MPAIDAESFARKEYDFVVVGGGSAGLVVATRLSEDPNVTVGVLEAGKDQTANPIVNVPAMHIGALGHPELDWQFTTVPQEGAGGNVQSWARGKALGGSSAINFGMYSQASRKDLDNWAALGNDQWTFDSLSPYYRKSETFHKLPEGMEKRYAAEYLDPELRGTDGPIQVSLGENEISWVAELWPETVKNAGYPAPKDPRSGSAVGGFNQLMTSDPATATRSYSANAYWLPNKDRKNLDVLTDAFVTELTWDEAAESQGEPRVSGAAFEVDGKKYTVKAKKEVIVSCGTIQSPQLLEVSGIGSRGVLQPLGIDVKVENPNIGENLQDHLMVTLGFHAADGVDTAEKFRDPQIAQAAFEQYVTKKSGPLTTFATATSFVSLSTLVENNDKDYQDVVSLLDAQPAPESALYKKQYELQRKQMLSEKEAMLQYLPVPLGWDIRKQDNAKEMFEHANVEGFFVGAGIALERPWARGTIHATSSDMHTHPAIDPRYLTNPVDLDILARSLLHGQNMFLTEPFSSKVKSAPDGTKVPMPGLKWVRSLEEAREAVKISCLTQWHPIGTCAMLPQELGGVVDQGGKVYGTRGLRVCDASVFPIMPQGNLVSLVYATAEKISDAIKADNKQ